MNTSPIPLPVCAYDGRCYRKNPQHFREYAHPIQHPSAATLPASASLSHISAETAVTLHALDSSQGGVDSPLFTPPAKRCRSEDQHSVTVRDDHCGSSCEEREPTQETGLASPELLLHFLKHAPHLSALVRDDNASFSVGETPPAGSVAALPLIDVADHWNGVGKVLQQAYAGMGFHPTDVQCVLVAACTLKPMDPLRAFPGWKLVGPFELAWRYCELSSTHTTDEATAAKLAELLHGRTEEDAARRWRCGRFRYDPPECQTVAVRLTATDTCAGPAVSADALSQSGQHLCFHRDHPTDAPGMLVEGAACSPKFKVVNEEGRLSAYLCTWYRAEGDAAALRVVHALEKALDSILADEKPASRERCMVSFRRTLAEQRRACASRRKMWVAPTYSGLGLCVPVDKKTEIGYREPNIPARVSFTNCLRDWEAHFVAGVADARGHADTHTQGNACVHDVSVTAPFSRSIDFGRLAEARPFTAQTSEHLDSIFLWADVANDEADFGASLELGLNAFSCILADRCVGSEKKRSPSPSSTEASNAPTSAERKVEDHRRDQRKVDPVLWHTFRLLDCAYMLLQRPLYRHILRCHLPLLANADHPVLFHV